VDDVVIYLMFYYDFTLQPFRVASQGPLRQGEPRPEMFDFTSPRNEKLRWFEGACS